MPQSIAVGAPEGRAQALGEGVVSSPREWPERRAVVLLSGGLDSATALAIACSEGVSVYAMTLDYGQLHQVELGCAVRLAQHFGVARHEVVQLDLRAVAASALTRSDRPVPKDRSYAEISREGEVPATYVPARNTIFLGMATAWAETLGAHEIYIGVNVLDASGYPDCRPEFVRAYNALVRVATHWGPIEVRAPLIDKTKAEIIAIGTDLGLDYGMTHSCYDPDPSGAACGRCDTCVLRRKGFVEAGIPDPTPYQAGGE